MFVVRALGLLAVASISLAANSYYIDPDTVDPATRDSWCVSQKVCLEPGKLVNHHQWNANSKTQGIVSLTLPPKLQCQRCQHSIQRLRFRKSQLPPLNQPQD